MIDIIRVLSFDLSTVCIGVIATKLHDNGEIVAMRSCPILPPTDISASDLGYMKSKKKLLAKPNGNKWHNTYYMKDEKYVSKTEKLRRDREVRNYLNKQKILKLSSDIGYLVDNINPTVINAEKNAMFNGILTIEILSKTMGTLMGIASSRGSEFNDYPVSTVRAHYNPPKLVQEFVKDKSEEYLLSLPDVTKAAFRDLMSKKYGKYGLVMQTDDEGDACVVFDHWHRTTFGT